MMRVRGRYVYDIEVGVSDELGVRPVCFGRAGGLDIFEELPGAGDGV
jgi:hypothetical protein